VIYFSLVIFNIKALSPKTAEEGPKEFFGVALMNAPIDCDANQIVAHTKMATSLLKVNG
jgi:hypothetical protein